MKRSLLLGAALSAAVFASRSAMADVQLYSFETGDTPTNVDGFGPNGAGSTVTQDTANVTSGANSALFSEKAPGFLGDITSSLPSPLTTVNNAPSAISADITVPTGFSYTGGYADLGITIFGNLPQESDEPAGADNGLQFQVTGPDEQAIPFATPGVTKTVTIPLTGTNPDPDGDFSTITYKQLLQEGFMPTGFEFFFDKNAAINLDIDNVVAVGSVGTPEPASLSGLILGGGALLARRRKA